MSIDVYLTPYLKGLKNHERLELIEDILGAIDEEGIIEEIRKVVNDPQWDDQK
jgi:hypothetical protein